jgi:hypothetical protein
MARVQLPWHICFAALMRAEEKELQIILTHSLPLFKCPAALKCRPFQGSTAPSIMISEQK